MLSVKKFFCEVYSVKCMSLVNDGVINSHTKFGTFQKNVSTFSHNNSNSEVVEVVARFCVSSNLFHERCNKLCFYLYLIWILYTEDDVLIFLPVCSVAIVNDQLTIRNAVPKDVKVRLYSHAWVQYLVRLSIVQ